jgi:hypothetical protein
LRLDPVSSITHVPLAGVGADHPPAAVRVLNHETIQRGLELLWRDASGGELTFEAKVLVLCSLEGIRGLHDFLI